MFETITDTANNPLSLVPLALPAGASVQFVIRFTGAAGSFLTADDDARVRALARRTGTLDDFVDLADEPIDLSPHAGDVVDFDLKVVAGEVATLERVALNVRVTQEP